MRKYFGHSKSLTPFQIQEESNWEKCRQKFLESAQKKLSKTITKRRSKTLSRRTTRKVLLVRWKQATSRLQNKALLNLTRSLLYCTVLYEIKSFKSYNLRFNTVRIGNILKSKFAVFFCTWIPSCATDVVTKSDLQIKFTLFELVHLLSKKIL